MDYQETNTQLRQEYNSSTLDRQRLFSVEADLRRELAEEKVLHISAAAQVGSNRGSSAASAEQLRVSEQRSVRQSEELMASQQQNLRQGDELRVTERAAATVYAEWQSAEVHLATSQGQKEELEKQKGVLQAELANRQLQASDEQEQIQRLRRQVQTLEEELDIREDQLIRVEPLVTFTDKGQSRTNTSPTRSYVQSSSSPPGPLASAHPMQSGSPLRGSQSPSRGVMGEASLQRPRSGSPLKAQGSPLKAPRDVQWLPPGRAQSILSSSNLSMPGSAQSMPSSLPAVLRKGEVSLSMPGSVQSMPSSAQPGSAQSMPGSAQPGYSSLPPVLGGSPVSSMSQLQRPQSRQS